MTTSSEFAPISDPVCFVSDLLLTKQDMGERVFALQVAKALKRRGPVHAVACVSNDCDTAHAAADTVLRCGRSFLRRQMCETMRGSRWRGVVYVPGASMTVSSFLRSGVLRLMSGQSSVVMVALQPRSTGLGARLAARVSRVACIAVSPGMFEQVRTALPRVQVVRLPVAVDTERFRPVSNEQRRTLRAGFGIPEGNRVYLHVGHLSASREVGILGRLARDPRTTVVVIASTATAHEESVVMDLLEAGVRIESGYLERIEDWYRCADCYVFPVHSAVGCIDTPASVLEAMATNLPVVSTRFGALREVFDTRDGFVFADGDEEIIAAARRLAGRSRCSTRDMLTGTSWDSVAAALVDALGGACGG